MKPRHQFLVSLMWISLLGAGAAKETDSITVEDFPESGTTVVSIRATERAIPMAMIAQGLARARGFDDHALDGVLPQKSLKLDSMATRLMCSGLSLALAPNLMFDIVAPSDPRQEPALRITMDRRALLASQRWIKTQLRESTLKAFSARDDIRSKQYGLALPADWEQLPAGQPMVVIVHGIHSSPDVYGVLTEELKQEGLWPALARLPNDQSIDASAHLLSKELKCVAERRPDLPVALVGASMGGLIARQVVEDPALDPGNVRRLIMVGTPNHGSLLGEFAFGAELWEHIAEAEEHRAIQQFYEGIEDGLGEAYRDLTPDSDYLTALNTRPRNPNVEYSLFLGSGAFLDAGVLEQARGRLKQSGDVSRFAQFFGPRLDDVLAEMKEVVRGEGDGAVAIARGRLEGVEDTVILPFQHVEMLKGGGGPAEEALRREVLARLRSLKQ